MPTFTFTKKPGAPAGAINISVPEGAFLIDDVSNTSIVTTDQATATDLATSPFLVESSVVSPTPVPPVIAPVFTADGVISTKDGAGNIVPVSNIGAKSVAANGAGKYTFTFPNTSQQITPINSTRRQLRISLTHPTAVLWIGEGRAAVANAGPPVTQFGLPFITDATFIGAVYGIITGWDGTGAAPYASFGDI